VWGGADGVAQGIGPEFKPHYQQKNPKKLMNKTPEIISTNEEKT
jgi:hypothetical protein